MNNIGKLTLVAFAMNIAACAKEPRSKAWFEENLEEARAVSAACGAKIDKSALISGTDECTNATAAVERADAQAYREEQNRKAKADLKAGVLPKISVPVK